jgi:hypothetical protein
LRKSNFSEKTRLGREKRGCWGKAQGTQQGVKNLEEQKRVERGLGEHQGQRLSSTKKGLTESTKTAMMKR